MHEILLMFLLLNGRATRQLCVDPRQLAVASNGALIKKVPVNLHNSRPTPESVMFSADITQCKILEDLAYLHKLQCEFDFEKIKCRS